MRGATWYLIAATLIIASGSPLAAQQSADTSLAARLDRAERMIEVLRQQVAEQAKARVEPKQGNKVELSGIVLTNGFYNNAKVNNPEIPTYVVVPDPPGFLPNSNMGGSARQSELTLTAIAPKVLGADFTGVLDMDFYGGQLLFARLFPLLHLKLSRAELRWPHAWVMAGEDAPPVSDVNPSTFAARSIPGFTNAGNLWLWIPQVRIGADAGGEIRVGIEASALAPVSLEAPTTFNPDPSRAERSRRPFTEGRVLVTWDRAQSTGEVSLGGHYGWIATTIVDSFLISRAATASAKFTVTPYVEFRGEAFVGQALASLGGGGIGQNLGPVDQPVRTRGGWGQLNLLPKRDWEVGGGYGFDDPDDADLDINTGRLKNVMIEGHLHWKPGPLVVALEFRRVETTYRTFGTLFVHHFNLGMGFRF